MITQFFVNRHPVPSLNRLTFPPPTARPLGSHQLPKLPLLNENDQKKKMYLNLKPALPHFPPPNFPLSLLAHTESSSDNS